MRRAATLSGLLGALVLSAAVTLPAHAGADSDPAPKRPVKVKKLHKSAAAAVVHRVTHVAEISAKPSFGQLYGLHQVEDPLDLKSGVALVLDQDTNEVLSPRTPRRYCPSRPSPS